MPVALRPGKLGKIGTHELRSINRRQMADQFNPYRIP